MMYSANLLTEKVELLDLTLTEHSWEWVKSGETWAGVELTGKSCLFSKIGIGARAAELVLRSRALTLHQAIRWRGQYLFLSEITEPVRGWLKVSAAVVELTTCRVRRPEEGEAFPAALTEKYVGYAQGLPMDTVTTVYVLVTPKTVELRVNALVEVGMNTSSAPAGAPSPQGEGKGEAYQVTAAHTLDPWKNEYEVRRKKDIT